MKKRYFHIDYQWPPECRSATQATVAVLDDGSSTTGMSLLAIHRLNEHVGQDVKVLHCNKLPSNYKPRGNEIE